MKTTFENVETNHGKNKTQDEIDFIKAHRIEFVESRIKDILSEVDCLEFVKEKLQHNKFDEFEQKNLCNCIRTLKNTIRMTEETLKIIGLDVEQ
jgi:hypothetical protein